VTAEQAEALALAALAFLAADERTLARFIAESGFDYVTLRNATGEPMVLAGVLDFLLADERMLLAFCDAENIDPAHPARARARLPGANPEW